MANSFFIVLCKNRKKVDKFMKVNRIKNKVIIDIKSALEENEIYDDKYNDYFNFFRGNEDVVSSYPKIDYIRQQDLDTLHENGEVTVDYNKKHYIGRGDRELPWMIKGYHEEINKEGEKIKVPGSQVILNDGTVATVYAISDTEMKLEQFNQLPLRASALNTYDKLKSNMAVDYLIKQLQRSAPGIQIKTVTDSSAIYPGIPEYITTEDGKTVVHINTDKLAVDTPMHLLGHLLYPIIKDKYPMLWEKLREEGLSLIHI